MTRVAHNKGKKSTIETRIKQSRSRGSKPFISLRNGAVEKQFDISTQAAEYYGVRSERVLEVLKGERKSTRGVTFRYIDER